MNCSPSGTVPALVAKYVFGDFSREFRTPKGRLFFVDLSSGPIQELVLGRDDRDLGFFVKAFGQDAAGELHLLAGTNLGPFGKEGQVLKIVPVEPPGTISRPPQPCAETAPCELPGSIFARE